jgi:hypothetical protein
MTRFHSTSHLRSANRPHWAASALQVAHLSSVAVVVLVAALIP